jgi:uncharacterized membrane protein YphA (DoxX/SURF4 family)
MINRVDSSAARTDSRLYKVCMVVARLGLAYLFFTQLWWKLPPSFGCANNFAFPQPADTNHWTDNGSSGLCYWMGLESIFAPKDRQVLIADMRPAGLPTIGINIKPIAQVNALLLDNLVIPGIRFFGWLIWLAEFWIFLSMLLGLFSRLGALVAIGVVGQLYVGLANIPRPFEWEWAYGAILLLSVALLGAAAGRFVGVDGWLRPRLAGPAGQGNVLARIALRLS